MKRDFRLSLSEKALRRIWREEGLLRRKRRKLKTKQRLRKVKQAWWLFEQTLLDTKDLCDIMELRAQAQRLGLPRYQYTARGEVTSSWHYDGLRAGVHVGRRSALLRSRHRTPARLWGKVPRLALPDRQW